MQRIIAIIVLIGLLLVGLFMCKLINDKNDSNDIALSTDSVIYTPDIESIQLDEETGITYVNNMLIVIFNNDISEDEIKRVVSSVNGKIVGQIPVIDQYQVQISTCSLAELEDICNKLNQEDCVFDASFDWLIEGDVSNYIPNDPWNIDNPYSGNETWNEKEPSGVHWWLEAIQAPSAWEYNNQLNKIKIGVIDCGFDKNHEDLRNVIKFTSKESDIQEHGTLVAGIIAAEANNRRGMAGINHNCELLTYDNNVNLIDKTVFSSRVFGGLTLLVEKGAKIVNCSFGIEEKPEPLFTIDQKKTTARQATAYTSKLLSKGYDFVVVQSAGNQNIDAVKNGYFCSINEDNKKMCAKMFLCNQY